MTWVNYKQTFLDTFYQSYNDGSFFKLKISKNIDKTSILKNLTIKKIKIKNKTVLNFLYCNKIQDITKNYSLDESINILEKLIWIEVKNAVLFTQNNDITLSYNKKLKSQLIITKSSRLRQNNTSVHNDTHDNNKSRFISLENNLYLEELWVINSSGIVNKSKTWKIRQIHKFIETLDSIIQKSELKNKENITITDMWSGKWYLTFAVYDFMKNVLQKNVLVSAVEYRKDLVDICNTLAQKCSFNWLGFNEWTIQNYLLKTNNILIALHACDTATDDAIYKWIASKSEIIILSPCCHKQIRKEISKTQWLDDILLHWILKERQSEIVTDTLRWLILELNWYKSQIFEYISDEHTHKNIMIVWVKKEQKINVKAIQEKIKNLKQIFWIQKFYLEELFN